MKRRISVAGLLLVAFFCASCASAPPPSPSFAPLDCSSLSATSLKHYDEVSKKYLNEITAHPPDNGEGGVVWNTRYYLESLLTAYEATGNPKYIKAFLDSGGWVLNMTQTLTFLDQDDPSAPGKAALGPLRSATGWPTYIGTFGVPVAIPTATGQVSLFAQSLAPASTNGAAELKVTQQPDGSLELDWWRAGQALQSFSVRSVDNLNTIASQPLVYGQSPGRLTPTGFGLPAPGLYEINTPLLTIWHAEHTGGILLPFVEFLLIARDHPGLVDGTTVSNWTSKVHLIASDYDAIQSISSDPDDVFVADGSGGLLIQNPRWMPSAQAGVFADADYVYAEATMRLLLYELTHDSKQLSIARGLVLHHQNFHWQISLQGWLLLKGSPCSRPWSNRAQAPVGSIWDSLQVDPNAPETTLDGGFFVDLLHFAKVYGLEAGLGLSGNIYPLHRQTFQGYLRTPFGIPTLVRGDYPTFNSTTSSPIDASDDPFAGSGFLRPEAGDASFVAENWDWMTANGQGPQDKPTGYFLRAWARSEAAAVESCHAQ